MNTFLPNKYPQIVPNHNENEEDTKDDDDTLLILSQLIDSCTSATPEQPHQAHSFKKAATRVSHGTLILSEPHLFPRTDARPLHFKRQEI